MTAQPAGDRPRILVFTFTPFHREPRALKQVRALALDYAVTTAGFGPTPIEGIPHIELDERVSGGLLRIVRLVLMVLRLYRLAYLVNRREKSAAARLSSQTWDLVVAHDVATLPVAFRLTSRRGVLVDLHEYAPRQGEHSRVWRLLVAPYFRWICRTLVPRAAGVSTVGQGIVDEYRRNFGFGAELVANGTPFQSLEPRAAGSPLRLVHSGIASPARKLEIMIDAVRATTADVVLDLYLVDPGSPYFEQLRALAGDDARIRFREPVAYAELVRTLNDYDVGVTVIAPSTFNLKWCLPNKFFDFIQARLGVITGPSPEMARVVERHGIGVVTEDFSAASLAAVLESLTPERVMEWKHASDRSARELSSEQQVKVWVRMVESALGATAQGPSAQGARPE